MKTKVSLFSKTLWKQYLILVSGVGVFTSFFFVAIEIPDKCKYITIICIVVLLILLYFALWVRANIRTSKKLDINGSIVEIKVGDIFKEGELRAINFNEYFDTVADDVLISKNSLNGRFLVEKVSDVVALDDAIRNSTHLAEMQIEKNATRLAGKKLRYKLGSVYIYESYLLVAFSRFSKDNRAYLSVRDYINCLMTFWEEVDVVYAGRTVAIPLMGAGITRFKDTNVSEQELLELLIWSFKVSRVKFRYPAKVVIVIYESIKDKINFYELKA